MYSRSEFAKIKLIDLKVTRPSHLGALITDYSKRIMHEAVAKMGGFESFDNTLYHCSTDSLWIHRHQYELLQQAGCIGSDIGQFKRETLGTESSTSHVRSTWSILR